MTSRDDVRRKGRDDPVDGFLHAREKDDEEEDDDEDEDDEDDDNWDEEDNYKDYGEDDEEDGVLVDAMTKTMKETTR